MNMTYSLFKGTYMQLHSGRVTHDDIVEMRAMSKVKNVWPMRSYSLSGHQVLWQSDHIEAPVRLSKRQEGLVDSSHIMVQVDKLRQEGHTGDGVKIAIVNSGVSRVSASSLPKWKKKKKKVKSVFR